MTKYLVKIISICTFVVLIPVIIAGVALSAIGSTLFNLDVTVDAEANSAASYTIRLGERTAAELGEQAKATYLNGTEVAVDLDPLVGYDFLGWYENDTTGERLDKDKEDPQDPYYTFELKHNTKLVASLKAKKYNLTFINIDDVTIMLNGKTVENKEELNGPYVYGDELPVLTAGTEGGVEYFGWRISGDTGSGSNYDHATFETSGDYTLEPATSKTMVVAYNALVDGVWTPFYKDTLTPEEANNFEVEKFADGELKQRFEDALGKGYAFDKWTSDEAGLNKLEGKLTFDATKPFNVYLQKTLVHYTLNVSKFATESENAPMTYDVEKGFGKTTLSRPYYTLIGLTYDGKDYVWNESTSDYEHTEAGKVTTLSSVILDATNADHTFNAVAIWEAEFKTLKIEFTVVYTDFEENAYGVFGKNAQGHKLLNELNNTVSYNVDDKDGIKLEDSIFATFTGNEFDSYFIMKDDVQTEVVFKTGRAYFPENIHGSTKREFNESATFADIIKVLSGYDVNVATEEIAIEFVFKEAAK